MYKSANAYASASKGQSHKILTLFDKKKLKKQFCEIFGICKDLLTKLTPSKLC